MTVTNTEYVRDVYQPLIGVNAAFGSLTLGPEFLISSPLHLLELVQTTRVSSLRNERQEDKARCEKKEKGSIAR